MATFSADTSTFDHTEFSTYSSNIINKKNITMVVKDSATAIQYTASEIMNGGIFRTGNSSQVLDSLPSASDIRTEMAARSGIAANSLEVSTSFDFTIYNNGSNAINLVNSSNLTIYGRTIVAAGRSTKIRVVLSNNFGLVQCEAYVLYGHR
ncbi:MAG: hypothetical protein GY823_06135 [Flavobacteriaceae bacterium]|nr:hypothetical protein [Flavobacteriaceae bacterium]